MRSLIYSFLYTRPDTSPEKVRTFLQMFELWYDHLRGPGRYTGDMLLFTNLTSVPRKDIHLYPIGDLPTDPRRAVMHRIVCSKRVPVEQYDVAMQLDLDILAVDDVYP